MLDLEEHVKEAVADVVARSFGVHQDQYLLFTMATLVVRKNVIKNNNMQRKNVI